MLKLSKQIALFLLFTIVFGLTISGCGTKDVVSDDQGASTKVTATPTAAPPEERVKLKMFMSNSGVAHPSGVDPSNNDYLKIVEDLANVDLELEVPAYNDFKTKLNLMLASSNIPDIVYTTVLPDVLEAAEAGMFIDLKKYYDASKNVKKYITPERMELSKTASGKYLRIPMSGYNASTPGGGGILVRYDLLKKYNSGNYPQNMKEWFTFFEKVKAENADMYILSPDKDGLGRGGNFAFFNNGINAPVGTVYVKGGKSVYSFTTPEWKIALQYYKDMYDKGYVDKEFLTKTPDQRNAIWNNGKQVLHWGLTTDIISYNATFAAKADTKNVLWTVTVPNKPEVGDIRNAYTKLPGLINPQNSLLISKSCKLPDRAFRVIESLADDKLLDMIMWGKEGEEHIVKDGKKVPVPEKLNRQDRIWVIQLALVSSFQIRNTPRLASLQLDLPAADYKSVVDSMDAVDKTAKITGNQFDDIMIGYAPDAVKEKEAQDFIKETMTKIIMGQQPMSWYDTRVTEFNQKYAALAQARADYMYKNRAELEKKGLNFWWEK